jgi:trans-aconitate methyltransferase
MSSSTAWHPQTYAQNARFVSDLGEPLLQLLEAKPGEMILDLGCGDGALTEKIAAAGCTVIGADASLAQVQAAKKRGLNALEMDCQRFSFRRSFDAVFSNAALHWMKQAENVAESVANCLKTVGVSSANSAPRGTSRRFAWRCTTACAAGPLIPGLWIPGITPCLKSMQNYWLRGDSP